MYNMNSIFAPSTNRLERTIMFRTLLLSSLLAISSPSMAGTMNINGSTIVTTGANSIVIKNGKVFVDGKDVTPDAKTITIQVTGSVQNLQCDTCATVTVKGNAGDVSSVSGDLNITGNVTGSATSTSGDIDVGGSVSGNVRTVSGDIKKR
jgi:hypothetical protein